MRVPARAAVSLALVVFTAACSSAPSATPKGTQPPAVSATPSATAQATHPAAELAVSNVARDSVNPSLAIDAATAANEFGLDLFAKLSAGAPNDNLVFSPTSIAIALAMARAGARGETASQMDTVLHSLGADSQAAAINALDGALSDRSGTFTDSSGQPHELTLAVANAPFAQRDEQWQQSYLDALAQRFGAGIRLVDYRNAAEAARQQINQWVSDQTNGRIPELIGENTLDSLTRLVLVNAIYLKAPWALPFNPNTTQLKPFTDADGTTANVETMTLTSQLSYGSGNGWQAVDLPYIGNRLGMTIILPTDFKSFASTLDAKELVTITSSLKMTEVELTMPRFQAQTIADLSKPLKDLGMPLAFDPNNADFSGMTTQDQLYIAFVIHQANISVDEKGTEAAAATAVGMAAASMPIGLQNQEMHVDRPFLFALRDYDTGAVLFLGQVTSPTAQT